MLIFGQNFGAKKFVNLGKNGISTANPFRLIRYCTLS